MKLHLCFFSRTRYIDVWQQHIFVRAKLSWNGILYWGEKRCCFIQREFSNSGSDKEQGLFSILRSVMLLKQSDFFLHFVIWCSRCCESWVWHPSRHSEWNVVVKVDKWTHFCNFVGDDLGIVKKLAIEHGKLFVTCLPLIVSVSWLTR